MQRRASARIKAAQTKSPNFQQEEREEDLGSESPLTELEDEQPSSPSPPKKRRRKTKVVEPVVYDIPPVESKMTTFRGIVFTKTVRRVVGAGLRIHSPHVASRSVGLRESSYLRGMWAPLLILEGLYQHHSPSYKAGSHLLQSVRPFFWSSRNSPRTRVGSHKGSRFRTCRIDTILKNGLDFAKDLGVRNTKDLAKLIQVGHAISSTVISQVCASICGA